MSELRVDSIATTSGNKKELTENLIDGIQKGNESHSWGDHALAGYEKAANAKAEYERLDSDIIAMVIALG